MSSPKKSIILICGPTAVGKTSIAISLAKHFHTEIISADSRQCFKELNIGVARPSQEELSAVTHHFIASHSIRENINAAYFEKYGLQKVNELFATHDVIIMVGGTGLYIKAFCEGLDEIPSISESVRNGIIANYETKGLEWLQNEIRTKDPQFFETGEMKNPQRIMRALEVVESTGQSILGFRKKNKVQRPFHIIKIGLELSKEELHSNINDRVDKMIDHGLVEEVRSLLSFRDLNALQTVGYSEVFDFIDGNKTLSFAAEEIKKNTRQYAKRQMTWFKKDNEINWFSPKQLSDVLDYAEGKL